MNKFVVTCMILLSWNPFVLCADFMPSEDVGINNELVCRTISEAMAIEPEIFSGFEVGAFTLDEYLEVSPTLSGIFIAKFSDFSGDFRFNFGKNEGISLGKIKEAWRFPEAGVVEYYSIARPNEVSIDSIMRLKDSGKVKVFVTLKNNDFFNATGKLEFTGRPMSDGDVFIDELITKKYKFSRAGHRLNCRWSVVRIAPVPRE